MNFGTDDLQKIIYNQLVAGQVVVRMQGGRGKFAKDLAKKLYDFLEETMISDMEQIAKARGASDRAISAYDRVCKAMDRYSMPFRPQDWDIYVWIIEQDKTGKTIEKFSKWARLPENLAFINQYFKDPQNIKTQWARAFGASETFQKNEDGSLYV